MVLAMKVTFVHMNSLMSIVLLIQPPIWQYDFIWPTKRFQGLEVVFLGVRYNSPDHFLPALEAMEVNILMESSVRFLSGNNKIKSL